MYLNVTVLVFVKNMDVLLITLESLNWLTILNSLHGLFATSLGYFFCIPKHLGSIGIYMGLTISLIFLSTSFASLIFGFIDLKETIEGENGLHKRVKKYNTQKLQASK